MNNINKKNCIFFIMFICYLIISIFFLIPKFDNLYLKIINPIVYILFFIISVFLYKTKYVRKKYKYDIMQLIILSLMVYIIIYYLSGLIIGYQKLPYSYKFLKVISNLIQFGSVLIFRELIREKIVNYNLKNKGILILLTIVMIISDISISLVNFSFSSGENLFKFICYYVLTSIIINSILTYIVTINSSLGNIIYIIVFKLLIYIIPIIPTTNWFLETVIIISFTMFLYLLCSNFYNSKINNEIKKKQGISVIWYVLVLMPFILILSGVTSFRLMGIISNSMVKVFRRGDAVLINKNYNIENIKVGDIIAFISDDKTVIHRVNSIKEDRGITYYQTKGDNNDDPDYNLITKDDIIGIYMIDIPYLGWPSIWLKELIK